ncbi:MAG TPA: threonine--tRNA ligase [Candidatus Paceibacterota bacterium]|nr:threonine--tRNA ligase [Candidatus Paceibacterota bacterium]
MEQNLEHLRHSLAHLLGAAVLELYPTAKLTLGPAIDDGFYYDVKFEEPIGINDLPKIEKKMKALLPAWKNVSSREVSKEEAIDFYKENEFKKELIEEIAARGELITLYTMGSFIDLCRGGHVDDLSTIDPDSFKLDRVAGAYWRGNEQNPMLTRIYGLAFESKEVLAEYLHNREEAEKRDHRKLGKELGLFTFSPLVGAGLPIWLPHGATVRRILERFIVDTELEWGYLHVNTPDIAKLDLYRTSGHYPYYKDSMYAPIQIDDEEFMLRPMTCPHHFQVFSDSPKSYRDLPMRIAELAKLYRYEASGELTGLVRVRGFCLADAHIICADAEQATAEVGKALDLIEYVAGVFGLASGVDYWYRLSLGDRSDEKKYYKNDEAWDTGEALLRSILKNRSARFDEAPGEAAFYGPKIDIQMKDVRGKENTAFTVQYDFCMPDRFNLEYTDKDGTKKRPLVIHRSSIGAIERVMAFLIEHYAGAFPTWLSPVQVAILPVGGSQQEYAAALFEKLKNKGVRAELLTDDSLGKRIREAKTKKIPYQIIVGDKEKDTETITVEGRNSLKLEQIPLQQFTERIGEEINTRKDQ